MTSGESSPLGRKRKGLGSRLTGVGKQQSGHSKVKPSSKGSQTETVIGWLESPPQSREASG